MERALLRNGNVHSADDWRSLLEPIVNRYRDHDILRFFRGDAAFADPKMYCYLEAEGYFYTIRLKGNQTLYGKVEHLLTRPVGRPPKKPIVLYHSFRYQAARHSRYVVFQMAEVVVPKSLFRQILERISRLRASPELAGAG